MPSEITVKRQEQLDGTADRPDFLLELERGDKAYAAVLETKLRAPISRAQMDRYNDAIRQNHDFKAVNLVLYKATPSYRGLGSERLTVLHHERIHKLLVASDDAHDSTWLIREYRRWIERMVRRDRLFASENFQDWYLQSDDESPPPQEVDAGDWGAADRHKPHVRRRVYWHVVRRAAQTISGLSNDNIDRYVNSQGNRSDPTAWVHLKVADVEDGCGGGSIFYRLDRRKHGLGFEFRLYAGPKKGSDQPEESEYWADIKKAVYSRLKQTVDELRCSEHVDLPGYQQYSFQKRAKETSLASFWLEQEEGASLRAPAVLPSQLYECFPAFYAWTREAVVQTGPIAPHIDWIEPL